jgi:hypothetical protein
MVAKTLVLALALSIFYSFGPTSNSRPRDLHLIADAESGGIGLSSEYEVPLSKFESIKGRQQHSAKRPFSADCLVTLGFILTPTAFNSPIAEPAESFFSTSTTLSLAKDRAPPVA